MRKGILSSVSAVVLGAVPAVAAPAPMPSAPVPPASVAPPAAVVSAEPFPGACDALTCPADVAACPCPVECPDRERLWAGAEYLLWWTKGSPLPPLVTTGPVLPAPACTGALGQPGTVVLFGGRRVNDDVTSGGRFTLGGWLDDCRRCGLEGSYFFLGSQSTDFAASASGLPGSPVLARPFFDPALGPCAELIGFPAGVFPAALGGAAGTVTASLSTRLQGFDVNAIRRVRDCDPLRLDLLAGFRYLDLRERLTVTEDIVTGAGTTPLANSVIRVVDRIDTENDFYGGQLGARAEYAAGRFFVRGTAKVALGTTHQVVTIAGSTRVTPAGGAPLVLPGGLLALPTNVGRYSRDRFSVVPEGVVSAGYQVTDSLRAFVSYTFLYWSDVVRPGDQIDPVINPAFVPTSLAANPALVPARPAFTFRDTDFWAQGVGFGLEFRY